MTEKRKTAGELTLKAAADQTKYDSLEIGHALVEDNSIANGLIECALRHRSIFDEDEYCVGYVIASDPLIKGVMRRKFYATLYLPSPRPEQAIFLYNKALDRITKRLWVLPAAYSQNPDAWTMEKLYLSPTVPKGYESMKRWTIAFYDGVFWPEIRKEHGITLLSEHEYLNRNREKLIEASPKQVRPDGPEAFDFSKVTVKKVVDPNNIILDKDSLNNLGKTQHTDRNVSAKII